MFDFCIPLKLSLELLPSILPEVSTPSSKCPLLHPSSTSSFYTDPLLIGITCLVLTSVPVHRLPYFVVFNRVIPVIIVLRFISPFLFPSVSSHFFPTTLMFDGRITRWFLLRLFGRVPVSHVTPVNAQPITVLALMYSLVIFGRIFSCSGSEFNSFMSRRGQDISCSRFVLCPPTDLGSIDLYLWIFLFNLEFYISYKCSLHGRLYYVLSFIQVMFSFIFSFRLYFILLLRFYSLYLQTNTVHPFTRLRRHFRGLYFIFL